MYFFKHNYVRVTNIRVSELKCVNASDARSIGTNMRLNKHKLSTSDFCRIAMRTCHYYLIQHRQQSRRLFH